MEDLADRWGPIYTAPSAVGYIKHSSVSKGAICRVKGRNPYVILGLFDVTTFLAHLFWGEKRQSDFMEVKTYCLWIMNYS
jgi:hypothetical protein